MTSLTGKRALVTGGARGMGRAIATRFADEGADVAFTFSASEQAATDLAALVKGKGRNGFAIRADNRDAAALERAVDQAADALGGLDILINNAGIFAVGPIDQLSLEAFDDTMAVNLRAVFVASKRAASHLGNGGRIISIGSNLASRAPNAGLTAYSASKAAISGFTRALARDLGPRGITVNAIHPGSTDTDMNPADGPFADGQRALTTTGRFASADDIAGVATFLASEQGRSVSGADWLVDNGANV